MAYTAEISRSSPSCFIFLIDQSGSMQEVIDPASPQALDRPIVSDNQQFTQTATGRTKAQGVADAINRLLQNLVIKCAKSEGVRDYYHVAVIGYGGDNTANRVGSAFVGPLAGRELVPINEIANGPARIDERIKKADDGAGGLIDQRIKFPIWFEPVADGGTPMCQALAKAKSLLVDWIAKHPTSFPPIVINITDGESTDGEPSGPARDLTSLSGQDGSVLLFNLHISSQNASPIVFPDRDDSLGGEFAKRLFAISSVLPPHMLEMARGENIPVSDGSRGFVFNADMVAVIRFLDIGTRPSNLR
jgi:hypothetical protein